MSVVTQSQPSLSPVAKRKLRATENLVLNLNTVFKIFIFSSSYGSSLCCYSGDSQGSWGLQPDILPWLHLSKACSTSLECRAWPKAFSLWPLCTQ